MSSNLKPAFAFEEAPPPLSFESAQQKLVELLIACHDNPRIFCEAILGIRLRSWQLDACERIAAEYKSGNRNIKLLVRAFKGAGKDFFVAAILLWFMSTRPNSRGLTTAPTWSEVENLLWPEVAKLYNRSLLKQGGHGRLLSCELRFGKESEQAGQKSTWFACGLSVDHPVNLEGHHSDTACIRVIDEAKAVDREIFDYSRGMLNAPENFDLWISTPSIESGPFWERDTNADPSVIRIVVEADDVISDPLIDERTRAGYRTWLEECKRDWGSASAIFLAQCKAQYMTDSQGALFPSSWIERAMREESFEVLANPKVGMDCAGSTDGDQNCIALCCGPDAEDRKQVHEIVAWHERDTMISKGKAVAAARQAKAGLRIDVIGLGKGIADAAALEGLPVEEYRASDKPRDFVRFANKKAEDAWNLRTLLEEQKMRLVPRTHPLAQTLKAQLVAMKYEIKQNGKLYVIDPADSPDIADGVIIGAASGGSYTAEAMASGLTPEQEREEDRALEREWGEEGASIEKELREEGWLDDD